jgi:hypothetical protein
MTDGVYQLRMSPLTFLMDLQAVGVVVGKPHMAIHRSLLCQSTLSSRWQRRMIS